MISTDLEVRRTAIEGTMSDTAKLPSASLSVLVQLLASQAMLAMGKMQVPGQPELKVDLDAAKHFVDLLGVLEEKTKGNLQDDEAAVLKSVAHELRMIYVAEKK
jgi:hypothetical protein